MTIAFNPKDWKDLPRWMMEDLWTIERSGEKVPFKVEYERLEGGFVPEIPYALMRRFTKPGWTVYDPMAGAMVTRRVGDRMSRDVVSVDIADRGPEDDPLYKELILADARQYYPGPVDMIIWHPPYRDIIKFTDDEADMSGMDRQAFDLSVVECLRAFGECLKPERVMAIVIGNIYQDRKVINLAHEIAGIVEWTAMFDLKGWVIKDIVGNRQGQDGLWMYRAVNSDSFVFRHETILIYKKRS